MFRRGLLLSILLIMGLEAPYWLAVAQAQERLRQCGAQKTYVVEWRKEGDMRRGVYWIEPLGLVTVTWRVE